MKRFVLAAAALAVVISACGGGSVAPTNEPPPVASPSAPSSVTATAGVAAGDERPEALIAKGRVTDAAGAPLAGVAVNADFQLSSDYSIDGVSGPDGTYRIALDPPNSSWHMSATYAKTWNGVAYTFELDPSDDSPFVGAEGGVRDFVWRLTGPTPEGDSSYGGTVEAYMDFSGSIAIDPQYVRLTLTPDGPLVDGSTGHVISAMGDRIEDVAVGRYVVAARYEEPGKEPIDLLVRVRNQGDYASSVTAQFEQVSATGQQLELEVRSP